MPKWKLKTIRSQGRKAAHIGQPRRRQKLPLTTRQREVLRLILDGFTNREIAERLGISVRTVEVHRFSLMRRLGVTNVAQLYQVAVRMGIGPRIKGLRICRNRRPAVKA